jgi:hypothetical protein
MRASKFGQTLKRGPYLPPGSWLLLFKEKQNAKCFTDDIQ